MCVQPLAAHVVDFSLCDATPSKRCSSLELPAELKESVNALLKMLFRASLEPPVIDTAWTIY